MSAVEQRVLEGIALPPAGIYAFDQAHTTVEFIGTHIFTKTRGRFTAVEGHHRGSPSDRRTRGSRPRLRPAACNRTQTSATAT